MEMLCSLIDREIVSDEEHKAIVKRSLVLWVMTVCNICKIALELRDPLFILTKLWLCLFIRNMTALSALLLEEIWIPCKRMVNCWFDGCLTVFEFGLGFITRLLRHLGLKLNQEGDGAEGGGGIKTGDQGHSAVNDPGIVFAEQGDEHKAKRAEGTLSFDEIERLTSTSNVPGERVITRRKHAVPSNQEKFPAMEADFISDGNLQPMELISFGSPSNL